MKMNYVKQFEAKETLVDIYETDIKINSECMYVIIATNKKTHKQNTRFGNAIQTRSIINSYHLEQKFKL